MRRTVVSEFAGWAAALGISTAVAAQVAVSSRSELMFRDGDSLVVAMVARSLQTGGPHDWAMSSVLFLPEAAVFSALSAVLPLDLNGLLAVSAVLNLLVLYGALRLAAGRHGRDSAPVMWSLIALGLFGAVAITEQSASRDALELASLQLTTTYYSWTVIAVIAVIGLSRRALDDDGLLAAIAVAPVAALATLSNPLFGVWATVPLGALLVIGSLRGGRRRRADLLLAVLIGGTALGMLGRIPLSAWIANSGAGYARPDLWMSSLEYYLGLLVSRLSSPLGILGSVIVAGLIALAVVVTRRATSPGERLVAASGWVLPLVALGAVVLGTHAARYLQPVVFAPLLALVAAPTAVRMSRSAARGLAAAAGAVVLAAGALSIPRLDAAAHVPDADLTCVTDWVQASGRTGAGQFWTVRLPKAHLDDPTRLVQVDHRLDAYAWLVDRTDFEVGAVTFLVEDDQSSAWELPVGAIPDEVITCGRYRILDFGNTALPLGPAHS